MENRSREVGGQSTSELFHFAKVRQACQSNDPSAALTSLIAWIGASHREWATNSVGQFAREIGDSELVEQIKDLRQARLSDSNEWSGDGLLVGLIHARDKMLSVRAEQRPHDSENEI
jgi:hypothetical protein